MLSRLFVFALVGSLNLVHSFGITNRIFNFQSLKLTNALNLGTMKGVSQRRQWNPSKINMDLDYITISAPGRERKQRIPTSLVSSFGKWIVNDGRLRPIIETEGLTQGWVDPISFEEVWLPLDLPTPQQRPAVAALIKDGSIRCIMPALDISVQASGQTWWNRGICSFPLARVWMDLNSADVSNLLITAYRQVPVAHAPLKHRCCCVVGILPTMMQLRCAHHDVSPQRRPACEALLTQRAWAGRPAWPQDGHAHATRAVQELGDGTPDAADEPPPGPWERLWSTAAAPAVLSLVEALAGPTPPLPPLPPTGRPARPRASLLPQPPRATAPRVPVVATLALTPGRVGRLVVVCVAGGRGGRRSGGRGGDRGGVPRRRRAARGRRAAAVAAGRHAAAGAADGLAALARGAGGR